MTRVVREVWNWPRHSWEEIEVVKGAGRLLPWVSTRDDIRIATETMAELFVPDGTLDEHGSANGRRLVMWSPKVEVLHAGLVMFTGWVIGDGTRENEEKLWRAESTAADYAHAERWRWSP